MKNVNEKTTNASLRILTRETDLEFLSQALGVAASRQHLKGERRSKRNPNSSVYEESLWIYNSPLPDSSELHEHIDCILTLLESNRIVLDEIRARIIVIDIFCMFSSENGQGSADLNAGLIKRLADQSLDLIIDLYPPSETTV